jgi:hypothetical protein
MAKKKRERRGSKGKRATRSDELSVEVLSSGQIQVSVLVDDTQVGRLTIESHCLVVADEREAAIFLEMRVESSGVSEEVWRIDSSEYDAIENVPLKVVGSGALLRAEDRALRSLQPVLMDAALKMAPGLDKDRCVAKLETEGGEWALRLRLLDDVTPREAVSVIAPGIASLVDQQARERDASREATALAAARAARSMREETHGIEQAHASLRAAAKKIPQLQTELASFEAKYPVYAAPVAPWRRAGRRPPIEEYLMQAALEELGFETSEIADAFADAIAEKEGGAAKVHRLTNSAIRKRRL